MFRALSFIDAKILDEQEDIDVNMQGVGGQMDDDDESSPNKRNASIFDEANAKKMYNESKLKEQENRGFTIEEYKLGK